MRFENWIAIKFILENRKKIIFSFFGILLATFIVFMSASLKHSITESVVKDLRMMGKNTILIGGDTLNSRDINFIQSIPDVDYCFYPDETKKEEEILFRGYPPELLKKMNLPDLRESDVILDSSQFRDKKIGDTVIFYIQKERKEFLIRGFYEELNPFQTMKVGKRVILSHSGFKSNISNREYNNLTVVFKDDVNSKDYTDLILKNLNADRVTKLSLLETPDIFKKMNKIIAFLNKTLTILLFVSFIAGGFFTFNVTASSIVQRKNSVGILKAIGMSKKRIFRIFFIQNLYILLSGIVLGVLLSVISLNLIENLFSIKIVIEFSKISFIILTTVVLGVLLGVISIKKIENLSVTELLKV